MKLHTTEKFYLVVLFFLVGTIYGAYIMSQDISSLGYLKGDCLFYRSVIDSILQDQDLCLANNISTEWLWNFAVGKEGELVPKHSIMMPLFSLPFYLFLGNHGLLLSNYLASLLLIALIYKINRIFVGPVISLITSSLYAFTTLFLNYSYNYSPDVFSSVFILAGIYFILTKHFRMGPFLLGLSVFAKVTNVVPVTIVLIYSIYHLISGNFGDRPFLTSRRERWTNAALVIFFFLMGLLPFFYANYVLFGSPIVTGYQRVAVLETTKGIIQENLLEFFTQPMGEGILKLLFDPSYGIVRTNLILITAVPGLLMIFPHPQRKKLILLGTVCAAFILLFAKFDQRYSSHYSNRYLMTPVALFSVFTSLFFNSLSGILERHRKSAKSLKGP